MYISKGRNLNYNDCRSGDPNDLDLSGVYLSYAEAGVGGGDGGHGRPRTGRSKSARSARPKSSKLRTRR